MHRYLLTALVAVFFVLAPRGLEAQSCGKDADVTRHLATKYEEYTWGRGLNTRGEMIAFYVNSETGTWTVTVRHPSRPEIACVVASGTAWTRSEIRPKDKGRPS
ncbi:MAG: hypothetical protein HOL85_14240 [Rhodospirillaceae bacterium]|jgi:hypothetical protein|nr:hypothetical protein [Rhodospirillaceae bacterium]MBT6139537.1 hypothetical protein [Rhodospirillaceae bacterium]